MIFRSNIQVKKQSEYGNIGSDELLFKCESTILIEIANGNTPLTNMNTLTLSKGKNLID